jgi:splicing factor 3B subunit 2
MPAATATLPNGNGTVVNGHADAKKSSAKSRGALKRLKAKAKAARAGTESEAETDKESDTEVCSESITSDGLELTQSSRSRPLHP